MAKQAAVATQAIGEYIDIGLLSPSPTNPRKRFYGNTLEELAGSIRSEGIIEPLIVRPDAGKFDYEIVCGERRYRAAKLAELASVPCIVRDLTDEQVLDIQIHENLHREDVHPMDEAYGYQFLMDKLECSPAEVAARVGKSEKYVLTRLKLNSLIDEAQTDLENGHLLLTYALEIAKFSPEIQKQILDNAAYEVETDKYVNGKGWTYKPLKDRRASWAKFIGYINEKILGLLSAAPFDTKATNLRKDGLACINCPERTGANVGLFEADQVDKKDACLNPTCYQAKKEQHLVNVRERIAHEADVKPEKVPLLDMDSWYVNDKTRVGKEDFTIVGKKPYKDFYGNFSEKTCDSSATGVTVSRGQFGKTYEVCLKSSGCKVHYAKSTSSSSGSTVQSEKVVEAEQKKRRERKEELIDIKVSEIVRLRVLRLASEKFSAAFSVSGAPSDLIDMMIGKMWTENGGTDGTTKERVVKNILSQIMSVKKDGLSLGYEQESVAKKVAEFSPVNRNHLLFLLTYGNSGAMYYESYSSQKRIRQLAEEYQLDYRLFDAEARLQVAEEKYKKHVPAYKLYLDAVRAGDEKAKIPRPYEPTYKPKD